MKAIILAAVILAVAHVGEGRLLPLSRLLKNLPALSRNVQKGPCERGLYISSYNSFVDKHILKEHFDRTSVEAWEAYLKKSDLCGKERFFTNARESEVEQICSSAGWRIDDGDQCASGSSMTVYEVESTNCGCCHVSSVKPRRVHVIAECANVENRCLPVHFHRHIDGVSDLTKPCR